MTNKLHAMKSVIITLLFFLSGICLAFAQVVQAEYFWGSDPGYGNGTAVSAADGNLDNIVETLLENGIATPGIGLRKFSIRIKDINNNWGPDFSTVVSVENTDLSVSRNISQAEWFWDNDPGQGLANTILALDGNLDNAVEILLKSDLQCPSAGLHKFRIRVKDAGGQWGPLFTTIISCENIIAASDKKVSQAEWFWNTDPGQGSGNTVLALDGNFSDAFEALLQNGIQCPGTGLHKFSIRIKDVNNQWGPVFTSVVSCENIVAANDKHIVQAEWFWNTDPGQGSGNAILALDGSLDNAVEALFSPGLAPLPPQGINKLGIRVKDMNGQWGPAFYIIVSYENIVAAGDQKIIQAEFFWDTDPGAGNANPLLTFDGSFDDVFEYIFNAGINTTGITTGHHRFAIRIKDNQGNWGPVFNQCVYFDDCPAPPVTLGNDTTLCDMASITLDAGAGFDTYLWSGGSSQQTLLVSAPGVYSVTVTHSSGCTRYDVITISPQQYADLGPDSVICSGEQVILTPGVFDTYLWSEGSTTQSISVSPSSSTSYSVTVNDDGCQSVDIVNITVNPVPVISIVGITEICEGGQVALCGSGGLSYQWSGGITDCMPFTPVSPYSYSVTGTDANNCTATASVTLTVHQPPVVTLNLYWDLSVNDTLCYFFDNNIIQGGDPAGGFYSGNAVASGIFDATIAYLGVNYITYTYTDIYGCTADAIDSVYVEICDNVNSQDDIGRAEIFPNPGQGIFFVRAAEKTRITVMSADGKKIYRPDYEAEFFTIDLTGYSRGIYFVKFIGNKRTEVLKVIYY